MFLFFSFIPNRLRQLHAGMKIKYVKDDKNFTFCYAEKNRYQSGKTSVVLVHGFTSSKDQWIAMFKVICISVLEINQVIR